MFAEGVYTFDRLDPGGETCFGISRAYWPGWEGWEIVDRFIKEGKIADLNESGVEDLVKDFYRINFWNRMQGDKVAALSPEVANELFDTSFNLDVPDAARFLQTALNMQNQFGLYPELLADGLLGPKTLGVLDRYLATQPGDPGRNEKILLNCMNGEQYLCYKGNPMHPYFRGWFLRV